jgi:hypothetical protein
MLTETQDMESRLLRHAGLWPYSAGNSISCGACSAPRIRDTSARNTSQYGVKFYSYPGIFGL